MKTYFKLGSWNVICDVCGFQFKADEVLKRWDGLYVCKDDYEPRHPSDFLRVREENTSVPYSRPDVADVFIGNICTVPGLSAVPGFATPGCSIPGRTGPTS
jgi:hypothetical protein